MKVSIMKGAVLSAIVLSVLFAFTACDKPVEGCTDPLSLNYNPDAEEDDGSCQYAGTVTLSCSNIEADRVLGKTGGTPDYIVPCVIRIEADLTIEPGVVIWFGNDGGFRVDNSGSLRAVGNDTAQITLRGEVDAAGSWKGLYFNSNNVLNELSYVTVSGGGNSSFDGNAGKTANIRVSAGNKLKLHNCTIEKSDSDGLLADGSETETREPITLFRNNAFTDNGGYPLNVIAPVVSYLDSTGSTYLGNNSQFIKIEAGRPVGTHNWHASPIDYLITNTVFVGDGSTAEGNLTIHPGTTIRFGADAGLNNSGFNIGYLQVLGTASSPVILTGEQQQPGAWKGIGFQSNNVANRIEHAVISYGGASSYTGNASQKANIVVGANSPGTVTVANCTITDSDNCGIYVTSSSTLTESGNSFASNAGNDVCNQ